jgi:hypothetical protein
MKITTRTQVTGTKLTGAVTDKSATRLMVKYAGRWSRVRRNGVLHIVVGGAKLELDTDTIARLRVHGQVV